MSSFCNSNFTSSSLNNSILDLMSSTSDSYPIGPVGKSVTDGLIYGSFMCVGDLLVQFSSNQSNSTVLTGGGSCNYPIDLSGTNLPNAFLITGNNQSSSGSPVIACDISSSGFGYSNVPGTQGTFLNFLCISPRPTYFKPKVPFITTGSPYIYWSDSSTLTLIYTKSGSSGTITFTDTSSMDISASLISGGGGGGGGGAGGANGADSAGQGGYGGISYAPLNRNSLDVSLNTIYFCHVGEGGPGGEGSAGVNNGVGTAGSAGGASWIGLSDNDNLASASYNNGGLGGNTLNPQQLFGVGGAGGTSASKSGKLGGNSAISNNVYYAAGGGGGSYGNSNNEGSGGNGSTNGNYGSGGKGSSSMSSAGNSGVDGVAASYTIGYIANEPNVLWGGGGGGGGGGYYQSGGGTQGEDGGKGADGCIQIFLTFTS